MNLYLSADVGGTKTLLRLDGAEGMLRQHSFSSVAYAGLDEMVAEFLHAAGAGEISSACFALAGPVDGRQVRLTNLPWEVDADALAGRFNIPHVELINDFQAVGYGISALRPDDLLTLQAGQAEPGNRL